MCYRRKYNGIKARFPENIFGEINLSSKDLMFGYKCSVWLNPRFATQPKEHFILIFFGALPFPAQVLPFDGPCGNVWVANISWSNRSNPWCPRHKRMRWLMEISSAPLLHDIWFKHSISFQFLILFKVLYPTLAHTKTGGPSVSSAKVFRGWWYMYHYGHYSPKPHVAFSNSSWVARFSRGAAERMETLHEQG